MRKGSKHNTKEKHQHVKEEGRKRRKDRSHKRGQKMVSKMESRTSYQKKKKKKQKESSFLCCLEEAHFRNKDTHRLKVK